MVHIFKILISVKEAIKVSKLGDFKSNFSFVRTLIVITKKYPEVKVELKNLFPHQLILLHKVYWNVLLLQNKKWLSCIL